jgi:hypothetical protein
MSTSWRDSSKETAVRLRECVAAYGYIDGGNGEPFDGAGTR